MPIALDAIRDCLDGTLPAQLATCAPDGTPNVTYVSEVQFVDGQHVALSFQFFNKTRENILANPRATALVIHPETAARFRIHLEYLRTETEGPVFESMKAKLAGIASHTGMSSVFRLRGSDVYRVLDIEHLPGLELPTRPSGRNLLASIRVCSQRMSGCADLASLLDAVLASLESLCDIHHAMVLMLEEHGERLYTVASRGYDQSGVGSEIPLGAGVIGVAARERTPIRITYMTSEYSYSRAIRETVRESELAAKLETEIPLPGLPEPCSHLAVPILAGARLLGVLYV
jgi:predicted pyridoxine 5'-phosphate oxidase superfamily flavin-nucleotide-binding protein